MGQETEPIVNNIIKPPVFNENDNQDYSHIDTKGVKILSGENGEYEYEIPDHISPRAYEEFIRYLYMDSTSWLMSPQKDISSEYLKEVKHCATFFQCPRLAAMAQNKLNNISGKDKDNETLLPSFRRKNFKWAYFNLRSGIHDMTDITINCTGGDVQGPVRAHEIVLIVNSRFLKQLISNLGKDDPREIELKIIGKPEFEAIMYYMYTMEFQIEEDNYISTWVAANYLIMGAFQSEVEYRVAQKINPENAEMIRDIAAKLQAQSIIEQCNRVIHQAEKNES
mmetsp:Transcript_5725/g.8435  ORF Transcript_5725/g.8435 Transcript_5725/m.8435 type:complete len:281 (-) Transcript_5725:462-1304(-)|eukprot:CAMPEP_0117421128 /NCGR_PEP_ID=MMETSP0758-20121206/2303_1 /TAXON_ID=63605 /ORGANISM="Percolomonas cosmopolitus, Strain AE-1 (ATCC 50343)" /LENGTH=280 /DNA_ID=CAMNT_0005203109 /DNA_START=8 /DNA_END=850 /DNA_ORIENTATION=-